MGKGRPQLMLGQGAGSSREEQRGGDAGWERMTESQQIPGKRHTQRHVRQEPEPGASLVAQWLRICLPMQGTRVRALVWEGPICRGATRPVSHNC